MTAAAPKRTRRDVALANAARAKQRTRDKLEEALRVVQAEMEANGGVYAANPRGISVAEVAVRAGTSDTVLAKARHKENRAWLKTQVKVLKEGKPAGKRAVRRTYTERISDLESDNNMLRTKMIVHELERAKAESRVRELEKTTAELREDLAQLRRHSIVSIDSKIRR